jgi:hypothetical protein
VSAVLEHDCGTIECHGAPSRPLRIYGRNGTRASKDSAVGVEATTDEELAHNRDSVCGLEPELMTAVAAGDAEIEALTVVRKPRLFEAHKADRVWVGLARPRLLRVVARRDRRRRRMRDPAAAALTTGHPAALHAL